MKSWNEFEHHPDGRRFHVRTYNGGKFQVYGRGLEHICECDTDSMAESIANVLEAFAEELDDYQKTYRDIVGG